ncbi:hypothetical protein [Selenomonas ruminantium]|uniref:Uncharacterized protein n=1 Tax=Selenomonas ruminantium TaxID=971 RepID=A0A1H0P4I3_SELRU|nr:hypothetical protein [Selenomonas ruminantium]SDO99987.1 hypothetical protein SAMN05216366_104111 [Selenomonas ruminantium]
MSGVCEAITAGIYVMGDYGGIAIHFKPGEKWDFQQDEEHEDRLVAYKNDEMSISLTVQKFYEVFKVKERKID